MVDVPLARSLSSSPSWKILDLLMNEDLQELDIAKSLGAPVKVARRHLSKLERAGLVVVQEKDLPSGKVAVYSLTRAARSVGYPPRGYQNLSESIIAKLVASMGQDGARMILKDIGMGIGEDIGRNLLSRTSSTKWNPQMYADLFVNHFLAEAGSYPSVRLIGQAKVVYEQSNCLFQELADKMPGLVCDTLDEAVHEGVDKVLGVKTSRLECKGHGDTKCAFCVTWQKSRIA